jgi:hypothetical protein
MTQALEFGEGASAACSDIWGVSLGQAPSTSDEMGQTGLALGHPGLIDAIAITDEDAIPVVNEGQEGRLGTARVDTIEGRLWRGHDPEPLEMALTKPGWIIDVPHRGMAHDTGNGFIGGLESQRDTVDDFLDGPQADGDAKYGGTERLDEGATGALHPGHLADQGAEPWPISGVMRRWQGGLSRACHSADSRPDIRPSE